MHYFQANKHVFFYVELKSKTHRDFHLRKLINLAVRILSKSLSFGVQRLELHPVSTIILCFGIEMVGAYSDDTIRAKLAHQTVILFHKNGRKKLNPKMCSQHTRFEIQ